MSKKYLIILLIIIIQNKLFAQTNCDCFERLANLAELKSFEDRPDSALTIYKKSLTFLPSNAKNYSHDYTLGKYFLKNSNLDSATFYLKKAIEGGYPLDYIKYDVNFDPLINSTYWNEVESSYRKIDSNFNWAFYNKIQQTLGIDQAIRKNNELELLAEDSLERYAMFFLTDSISFFKITEQLNLYGYPSQLTHGFDGGKLMVFFLHSSMYSKERYDKIISILLGANKDCLCYKVSLALLEDRRLDWFYNKKQLTGTWNNSGKFNPIENLEEVDSIRFNYNMLTLSDYGKITGRIPPKEYQEKNYPRNYFCEDK